MREPGLDHWMHLVASRSRAMSHRLSDDVIAELAMYLADVYAAERAAGRSAEAANALAHMRLERATFEEVAARERASTVTAPPVDPALPAHAPSLLAGIWQDLGAAVTSLLAARGFSAIAVLTLAAGLALGSTLLGIVNAYLLQSLPYPSAHRLYRIDYGPFPWPEGLDALDWTTVDDLVELRIAWDLDGFHLMGGEYPESAQGAWVTHGFIAGMDVRAARGRSLTPEDFQPDSPAVALISHRLWQSRFGGQPNIVGTTFNAFVNDRPEEAETYTIVGVLPPDLWLLNTFNDVLVPLKTPRAPYQVRLREGVAPDAVAERIALLVRGGASTVSPQFTVTMLALHDSYVGALRPLLWSVVAGAGLVVLIATANVAVLMIVRARKRERELAVRLALGASHLRIARMVTFEGALIGASATALGLLGASVALPSLGPLLEPALNRRVPGGVEALSMDPLVWGAAIACGIFVTVLFTAIPVVMMWRARHSLAAVGSARGTTEGARIARSRAALIAFEVAASLTLLIGAALMAESALRMLRVDFGIDGRHVMTAMLSIRQQEFPEAADRAALHDRLERELRGLSRNSAVALANYWPLQTPAARQVETTGGDGARATVHPLSVSAQYFTAVGMRVQAGRGFTAADRLGSEPVMIVSTSLAARLWPRGDAIGQALTLLGQGQGASTTATIVGVVNDVRQSHGDLELFDIYQPLAQEPSPFVFLYLRGELDRSWERDVRMAIARVHPAVALSTPRALEVGLEQERARPRLLAYLLTTFAALACALALIGLHGVIAYTVRQRQREIAVRVAIGADPRAVTALFLRYGVTVLTAGLIVGTAGSMALGRLLQSQLYGVRPTEPRVFLVAVLGFSVVALGAVLWPARRAAAIDPLIVLKDE